MTDVEVAELTQRMKDRSLGDGISAGLCADLQRAAALIERLAAEKAEADEAMRQQAVIIANSVARTRLTEAESLLRDCWPIIDAAGAGWLRAQWPAHLRAADGEKR
jgi:hypothetical protein